MLGGDTGICRLNLINTRVVNNGACASARCAAPAEVPRISCAEMTVSENKPYSAIQRALEFIKPALISVPQAIHPVAAFIALPKP